MPQRTSSATLPHHTPLVSPAFLELSQVPPKPVLALLHFSWELPFHTTHSKQDSSRPCSFVSLSPCAFFFSSLPLPHATLELGREGSGCFLSLRDLLPQHCPWKEHHVTPTFLPKQDLHVSEWWVTGVILLAPQDSVHEKI